MNVIIVDDDILVCAALKTILESDANIEVLAVGHDGEEAVSLYQQHKPDILLMDIRMKRVNGLDAAKEIFVTFPEAKILLLTTFTDDEYIIQALKLGIKGYLLKQDYESIIPALRTLAKGQTVFGSDITDKLPNLLSQQNTFSCEEHNIGEREYELIRLVADGLSNKEIALTMYLSEGTVRNYLSIILEKLELRDRTQLAIFYYQRMK